MGMIKSCIKDDAMYLGIFAEIGFVAALSLLGLLICFLIKRLAS